MKKKNGFVFMETLVVISVLAVTLVLLFSSYSYLLRKSKERNYFDTPETTYKTYFINDFILKDTKDEIDETLNSYAKFFKKHSEDEEDNCLTQIFNGIDVYSCDLSASDYDGKLYELKNSFEVDKIYYLNPYLVINDSTRNDWIDLFDATTIDYLYNISEKYDHDSYALIVKFNKKYSDNITNEVLHSSIEVIE